ncbi:GNAT family N-acetyltransferase [Williamsia sp. 1135]|uniref:GNAT family N-acetyltransferase n=1 Tax=Williamsia sp. 1135 TaxID=1889262 RepID=UPI000A112DE5|nr:GNAT family N-acetyltransferase [Williamsia sp. 1135]ORM23894.1 GNAT family N-acetyltransferase [Williamsia sp. 1135]
MLKLLGDRPLGERDFDAVARALAQDPVSACMVAARVEDHGINPRSLGGELWSNNQPGTSLCFSGANLVPLIGTGDDVRTFAERAVRNPRACSSIVGPADLVMPLWELTREYWGPAREIRMDQPLLALASAPAIPGDPFVRRVRLDEIDAYLPAAVEMFIGEVGVDPCAGDGGRSYRRRIAGLINAGRAYAKFERGEVVFKAEVGALSRQVGQIQGVWVTPDRRGLGLGASGTASVVEAIVAGGRTASLYVNSFNTAAREAYRRVGMKEVGTFATVLVD